MVEVGMKGSATVLIDENQLACHVGSGSVELFGTPMMLALMEKACWTGVQQALEDGQTTVGISAEVQHLRATPKGQEARAEAEVTEVKGKVLVFAVKAYDETGLIGEGSHTRAIIRKGPFEDKAYGRA